MKDASYHLVSLLVAAAILGAACASPLVPPPGSETGGVCLVSDPFLDCPCCPADAAATRCCDRHAGTPARPHAGSNGDSRPDPLQPSGDCACCVLLSTSVVIAPPSAQEALVLQPASAAALTGDLALRGFDCRDALLRPPIA